MFSFRSMQKELSNHSKKKTIQRFAAGTAVILGGALLLLMMASGFWSCPLYRWTRLYCAGCGGTRAVQSILSGDLPGAFRANPGLFLFIFYAGICILVHRKFPEVGKKLFYLLPVAVILYGILRNLPFEWAKLLAPPM